MSDKDKQVADKVREMLETGRAIVIDDLRGITKPYEQIEKEVTEKWARNRDKPKKEGQA